jgi:hypothetical protein
LSAEGAAQKQRRFLIVFFFCKISHTRRYLFLGGPVFRHREALRGSLDMRNRHSFKTEFGRFVDHVRGFKLATNETFCTTHKRTEGG